MNAVSIVAIIFSIGIPVSIPIIFLVLSYRKRRRLMDLHHAERMAAIERGMEIPPLPVDIMGPRQRSRSTLLPGLIWFFVGLALLLGLHGTHVLNSSFLGLSLLGLVPTAVGLAFLVYHFVEERKPNGSEDKP